MSVSRESDTNDDGLAESNRWRWRSAGECGRRAAARAHCHCRCHSRVRAALRGATCSISMGAREMRGGETGVSVCGLGRMSAMRPEALDENGAVRQIDRPLRLLHCRCRSRCYCPSVKARASIACRPETTWKHSARIEWRARRIAAEESDEGARHGSQPPRICLTPALSLHRQRSALTSTLLLAHA